MSLAVALRALAVLPLSACVAGGASEEARIAAAMAMPETATVTIGGDVLTVARRPGPAGAELTAAGARPVAGDTILVSRSPALGRDQGALAKKAAVEGCAMTGGAFNDTALGAFDRATASWVFAGGCA